MKWKENERRSLILPLLTIKDVFSKPLFLPFIDGDRMEFLRDLLILTRHPLEVEKQERGNYNYDYNLTVQRLTESFVFLNLVT